MLLQVMLLLLLLVVLVWMHVPGWWVLCMLCVLCVLPMLWRVEMMW